MKNDHNHWTKSKTSACDLVHMCHRPAVIELQVIVVNADHNSE